MLAHHKHHIHKVQVSSNLCSFVTAPLSSDCSDCCPNSSDLHTNQVSATLSLLPFSTLLSCFFHANSSVRYVLKNFYPPYSFKCLLETNSCHMVPWRSILNNTDWADWLLAIFVNKVRCVGRSCHFWGSIVPREDTNAAPTLRFRGGKVKEGRRVSFIWP